MPGGNEGHDGGPGTLYGLLTLVLSFAVILFTFSKYGRSCRRPEDNPSDSPTNTHPPTHPHTPTHTQPHTHTHTPCCQSFSSCRPDRSVRVLLLYAGMSSCRLCARSWPIATLGIMIAVAGIVTTVLCVVHELDLGAIFGSSVFFGALACTISRMPPLTDCRRRAEGSRRFDIENLAGAASLTAEQRGEVARVLLDQSARGDSMWGAIVRIEREMVEASLVRARLGGGATRCCPICLDILFDEAAAATADMDAAAVAVAATVRTDQEKGRAGGLLASPVAGAAAVMMPCGHAYHYTCLQSWFDRQATCPVCRADAYTMPARPTAGLAGGDDEATVTSEAAPSVGVADAGAVIGGGIRGGVATEGVGASVAGRPVAAP